MEYEQIIRKKMNQTGGMITANEIKEANIPTVYLTRMMEKGEIIRAERGIYLDSDGDYDEYYFFQKRYKIAIFSYLSALYLHRLTEVIPQEMEVSVYKGYNAHRMSGNVRVHYINKAIHNLGVTECNTQFGNKVKVYNLERTICDLIKNNQQIDPELFAKSLNAYIRSENKDLNRLYEYSKIMKIQEKVKGIMVILNE